MIRCANDGAVRLQGKPKEHRSKSHGFLEWIVRAGYRIMEIKINKNIRIWQETNPIELSLADDLRISSDPKLNLARFGFSKTRICIKDRWFDVLTPSELVRKRNKSDGYFRVIYIQINYESGEYYIGKANRSKWSELMRYQGSGLKFSSNYKKNKDQFVRYFIALCETAEETEKLEASIIDKLGFFNSLTPSLPKLKLSNTFTRYPSSRSISTKGQPM